MKYTEQQKVTIQSSDWYNEKKQANGFIIFRDEKNKIATFSPGMLKFCGQTFTINKVNTGSSIFPDHYTFVEDGGMYKWTDDMISSIAAPDAEVYKNDTPVTEQKPQAPKPEVKTETKPQAPKQDVLPEKPRTPKPEVKVEKPQTPKPEANVESPVKTETKVKPETKVVSVTQDKPKDESPEPNKTQTIEKPTQVEDKTVNNENKTEKPNLVDSKTVDNNNKRDLDAFESFSLLLRPRMGASIRDCAEQAVMILSTNAIFPSATFDFKDYTFTISRK